MVDMGGGGEPLGSHRSLQTGKGSITGEGRKCFWKLWGVGDSMYESCMALVGEGVVSV